ncbi:MAG: 2-oxoisovalerate dehydrogenase [Chitinophagaceae bacterium]|nr:MAG: 2-oxoisovalerate dehydrogenase [Chitinophagaceae bacterium]
MKELIFLVEEAVEGGYQAKALGESIFTEAESLNELKENIKEAVECHFDEAQMPKLVRLHIVKDELLAL